MRELEDIVFLFVFDTRSGSRFAAALNACQTFFICFLLGFGAMTFSSDANKLVLTPIERMIAKLDKIRMNPLEAMSIGAEDQQRDERKAAKRKKEKDEEEAEEKQSLWRRFRSTLENAWSAASGKGLISDDPMETVVLEKTIIKIGSLLALGFGEAGAEIIGENMKGQESSQMMGMAPGRKVEAIFAFCNIR